MKVSWIYFERSLIYSPLQQWRWCQFRSVWVPCTNRNLRLTRKCRQWAVSVKLSTQSRWKNLWSSGISDETGIEVRFSIWKSAEFQRFLMLIRCCIGRTGGRLSCSHPQKLLGRICFSRQPSPRKSIFKTKHRWFGGFALQGGFEGAAAPSYFPLPFWEGGRGRDKIDLCGLPCFLLQSLQKNGII